MITYNANICKSNTLYYILGSLLGLAVVIIILLCIKKTILMWLYERNLCFKWISRPEPKEDTVLQIDAFLAFSHVDVDLIKEYLDNLERGPREYRLCFYQRDWQIGASIPDCILQSIQDSRRIIILLTNNFINSPWAVFEFRSAIRATSMDPNKRLLVIMYPDANLDNLEPELKRYLTYNTYLRRDDPQFWRKLMFAMPHKEVHGEQPEPTERPAIGEIQL
ncbi:protein toll-like [Drosophila innubila]|uniref:protein toll-like n=1 Tax=Drosophila innubila TaxID=198719 RepID=UPI00148C50E6|nr:protein toll-like [Drosophila innubila]